MVSAVSGLMPRHAAANRALPKARLGQSVPRKVFGQGLSLGASDCSRPIPCFPPSFLSLATSRKFFSSTRNLQVPWFGS